MKLIKLILFMFGASLLTSCQLAPNAEIVTTLFPHYDFAKQIVGDKMNVSLLIPPGAEAHDYEPTSRDLEAIRASKLFIFSAYEWDTWLGDNVENYIGDGVSLNIYENLDLASIEAEHNDEHQTMDEHDHQSLHFWTDPKVAIQMLNLILNEIISLDPVNRDFYTSNTKAYIEKIDTLDAIMHNYFSTLTSHTVLFAGHNAMDFFAARFQLEIISLTTGFQPDADITSLQLETLIKNIESSGTNYIFVEELKEPKLANTIKTELEKKNYNISVLELHGYHNVTKKQLEDKVSYLDLMTQNFNNLKLALKV